MQLKQLKMVDMKEKHCGSNKRKNYKTIIKILRILVCVVLLYSCRLIKGNEKNQINTARYLRHHSS